MAMKFFHTLGFKLDLGIAIVLLVGTSLFATFQANWQSRRLLDATIRSAANIGDVINKSTRYSMLLNRTEDVHQIIMAVGTEPNIEAIRIYDRRGQVAFSTATGEIGTQAYPTDEPCKPCHAGSTPVLPDTREPLTRIITSPTGYRVLSVITPIRNEPSCSSANCHAHEASQSVLGILDVMLPLTGMDENASMVRTTLMLSAFGLMLLLTIFTGQFLRRMVSRPVRKLVLGTEEVIKGNLDHRLEVRRRDEIGMLASSFNDMTLELKRARSELTKWTETLEQRVAEKTEELRRAQSHMVQIEKMVSLGTLSATVAHELNNPMEGILTYAKLLRRRLQRGTPSDEDIQEMISELTMIADETSRCGNIVKNLLLFSREKVGDFKETDLRSVVEQSLRLIDHHMKMNNIQVQTAFGEGPITAFCDGHQIEEALLALEINAVEAMPDGGEFRIAMEMDSPPNVIRISVADNGTGIPPEVLPHIFEPFYTTKKDGKGTGLGLSVVYGIMERHGGRVEVTSAPGSGAAFTLILPRRGQAVA